MASEKTASHRLGWPASWTLWDITNVYDDYRRMWLWEIGRTCGEGAWTDRSSHV